MLSEDYYGAILKKKRTDAHDAKEMQLWLSHQLFDCDDVKRDFEEDRENWRWYLWFKDVEAKYERRNWKYQQKPWK